MIATSGLHELHEAYRQVPHTTIPSNEPYTSSGFPDVTTERQIAKTSFLQETKNWPELTYPNLDSPSLDSSENAYWGVLNGLVRHESLSEESPPEFDLLYERAARKLAEVYRHMEIRRLGNAAVGAAEVSRERASTMSAELFGEPDARSFRSLLAFDMQMALDGLQGEDATRSGVAQEYLGLLGMTPESAHDYVKTYGEALPAELTDETVQTIRGDLTVLYPELPNMIATFQRSDITPAADAVPAFEAALRVFGLDAKGWRVNLTEDTSAADTHGATSEITFGRNRKPFTPAAIIGVPVHEAVHALRKQNASEQPYRHRRGALPESLAFDEGLCVALEQIITGEKRVGGKTYYTQLGLQLGMESEQGVPRDFGKVYEIMWRQRALSQDGDLTDAVLAKQKELAYGSVTRTTRGNSNDFRDISYFEGSRKAVDFLNSLSQQPAEERLRAFQWVFSGVFDPTNPVHASAFRSDHAV